MLKMCPICRSYHNPETACSDKTGSYLREIGIKPKKMSEDEFKKTVKEANKSLIKVLIFVAILFVLIFLLYLLRR